LANETGDLGYIMISNIQDRNKLEEYEIGRVIMEHKERYIVKTEKGEYEAEITVIYVFRQEAERAFPQWATGSL
jgi:ribosome biogenesis GTPase